MRNDYGHGLNFESNQKRTEFISVYESKNIDQVSFNINRHRRDAWTRKQVTNQSGKEDKS